MVSRQSEFPSVFRLPYSPTSFFQRNKAELVKIAQGLTGLRLATSQSAPSGTLENNPETSSPVVTAGNGNLSGSQSGDNGVGKMSELQQKSKELI